MIVHFENTPWHQASANGYQSWKCGSASPDNLSYTLYETKHWWLTYDFHFVGGVDLSRSVGDVAGVLPAVLRRQILQTQSPSLLLPFPSCSTFLVYQWPVVLQPDNVRARITACRALQAHRAAHWARDDAFPHLCWLSETWTNCKSKEKEKKYSLIRERK